MNGNDDGVVGAQEPEESVGTTFAQAMRLALLLAGGAAVALGTGVGLGWLLEFLAERVRA